MSVFKRYNMEVKRSWALVKFASSPLWTSNS
jgi:hypothetical protein